MAFNPEVNQELCIGEELYMIAPHPVVNGIPFGQEGRQAIVYKIDPGPPGHPVKAPSLALKVFKTRYQDPGMADLAASIRAYSEIPGMAVCQRTVLTPGEHRDLLQQFPDLNFAVAMPWVDGPTWTDILLEKKFIDRGESLVLAQALAGTLAGLESKGMAHCDLSSPNIILPGLEKAAGKDENFYQPVELVDVEQLFSPDLRQPRVIPTGSPGYAHNQAREGLWFREADRFAGALLLAEIMAWSSPSIREAAWGESFFDPEEMQEDSGRFRLLKGELRRLWGEGIGHTLEKAWFSRSLADCPSFHHWQVLIPALDVSSFFSERVLPGRHERGPGLWESAGELETGPEAATALKLAQSLHVQGNLAGALEALRLAYAYLPNSQTQTERWVALALKDIERDAQAAMENVIDHPGLLGNIPADGEVPPPREDEREAASEIKMSQPSLAYIEPKSRPGSIILVDRNFFMIGRNTTANYMETAPGVSRIHMEVLTLGQSFAVRDLNSTNGTFLNGQRLYPFVIHPIADGDVLRLADQEYRFKIGPA